MFKPTPRLKGPPFGREGEEEEEMVKERVKRQRTEILERARLVLERSRELTKKEEEEEEEQEEEASEGLFFPCRSPLEIRTLFSTSPSSLALLFVVWVFLAVVQQRIHVHASVLEVF